MYVGACSSTIILTDQPPPPPPPPSSLQCLSLSFTAQIIMSIHTRHDSHSLASRVINITCNPIHFVANAPPGSTAGACPSAVSDAVYSEGVHEFVVEVGCIGLLGFIDTAFVDERTKVVTSQIHLPRLSLPQVLTLFEVFCGTGSSILGD
jgi:hypothetical protein